MSADPGGTACGILHDSPETCWRLTSERTTLAGHKLHTHRESDRTGLASATRTMATTTRQLWQFLAAAAAAEAYK